MAQLKKYLIWMLATLFALLPAAGLAAENRATQISTTLPEEHMITVVCSAGGAVRIDGTVYTGKRAFAVERLSAFELEAVPDVGYRLSQVMAQPSGGVSISGNTMRTDSVYEGKTLTLSFVREQVNPTSTVSPTQAVSPTPTMSPTTSPNPQPDFDLPFVESQGNVLYDDYLGTGAGLKELGILYDEDYELDEYELLAVLNNKDWTDGNMLLVIAQPEDNGTYVQHNLVLSGLQLARLWQEKQIQWIELRNGEAGALIGVEELVTGNGAKLIHRLASGEQAVTLSDLEALPEVQLSAKELALVAIEVHIVPPSEVQDGYRMDVYLWNGGVPLCIT